MTLAHPLRACHALLVAVLFAIGLSMTTPGAGAREPSHGARVRVLQRELLGRYIDDIDFVATGPLADHIVVLNGYEVHGVAVNARSRTDRDGRAADRPRERSPIRPLFDLRGELIDPPTGIAYLASERLFAVVDPIRPTWLLVVDHRGTFQPPRPIRYRGGVVPDHMEGLASVPSGSRWFPDHLLTVTWHFVDEFPFTRCRIQVLRRGGGDVAAEIPIPDEISTNGVFGVAFLAPDRLVVSDGINALWTLDLDGRVVSGPRRTEFTIAEGIVQLPHGRVVTSEGPWLRFYDAALDRRPQDDRDLSTRIGLTSPYSVAWNPDTRQHLVVANQEAAAPDQLPHGVAAVAPSLDASAPVIDLSAFPTPFRVPRATYVPDEHLIAVALRRRTTPPAPAQIALYDNGGAPVELIDVSAIGGLGQPVKIGYLPPTREFAIVEGSQPHRLKILTRSGLLAREIDLAPLGVTSIAAFAYFNPQHPSGGQFLIFANPDRAIVTDFDGQPLREFDFGRELGVRAVAGATAITNGPFAGAFAVIESAFSARLVVFALR
jgi:hypothetical protein